MKTSIPFLHLATPLLAGGALLLAGCSNPQQLAEYELEEKKIPLTAEEAVDRAGLGDLETLRLMETAGLDLPAARNEAGDSALLSAVRSDNADSLAYLIERGHNIEATDTNGETPVLIAVKNGHAQALPVLLQAKANLEATDADGDTALLAAIRADRKEFIAPLLDAGAKIDAGNRAGLTPLSMAVVKFDPAVTRQLLEAGANPMTEIAPHCSALVFATAYRQPEIVQALLNAGADPNRAEALPSWHRLSIALDEQLTYGPPVPSDPFLVAVPHNGQGQLTAMLLRPRTTLAEYEIGSTTLAAAPVAQDLSALALAIRNGDSVLTKSLLEKGADANAAAGRQRLAPILLAAIEGDREIIKALIEHGADVDAQDATGQTALGYAVHYGQPDVVAALVEMGANANGIGVDGQAYLTSAAAKGDPAMVKALLDAGAEPNLRITTPVSKEFLKLIRTKHARKMLAEDYNLTPLMLAASHGEPDTIRALLQGGAKKNVMTAKWKFYPINFAVTQSHLDASQLLLGMEPDPSGNQAHVIISLSKQRATLFENGETVMTSPVSTGKRGHRTPAGQYVITNKHRHWNSTIYGSSMPYFMRLNCGSFGMHVGQLPGYPASHGCIRMPWSKAKAFFGKLPVGTRVDIVQ